MAELRPNTPRRHSSAEPADSSVPGLPGVPPGIHSSEADGGILRSLPPRPPATDTDITPAPGPSATPVPAPSPAPTVDKPLTVSQLTRELKYLLQTSFPSLFIEGEISGCKAASSGHVYFTLKDEKAAISCVLWGTQAARLKKALRDGDKVEIRGSLDIFPARGTYQIIVQNIRPAGLGRLFAAFQEMKDRLEQEGLFDPARKRPIPSHPRIVGVITSPTGAVIRDILHVLARRAPHINVLIYPTRVQGDGSAQQITHAIRRFNSLPPAQSQTLDCSIQNSERRIQNSPISRPDVLIVGRGGGSLEDLWAFNEEVVARAIVESEIPVISAVGHETDFTIANFVADLRAPTPSAAAEVVARDSAELLRDLTQTTSRLKGALKHRIGFLREAPHLRARLQGTFLPRVRSMRDTINAFRRSSALQRPLQRVNEERQRLDHISQRMVGALEKGAREATLRQDRIAAQLVALNPRAVLSRGYSITMNAATDKAVRRPEEAPPGTPLRIILHAGHLDAIATPSGVPPARSTGVRGRACAPSPVNPAPGQQESPASSDLRKENQSNITGETPVLRPATPSAPKPPRARRAPKAAPEPATPDLFSDPDPDPALPAKPQP